MAITLQTIPIYTWAVPAGSIYCSNESNLDHRSDSTHKSEFYSDSWEII